jgi:hypothetical protein
MQKLMKSQHHGELNKIAASPPFYSLPRTSCYEITGSQNEYVISDSSMIPV